MKLINTVKSAVETRRFYLQSLRPSRSTGSAPLVNHSAPNAGQVGAASRASRGTSFAVGGPRRCSMRKFCLIVALWANASVVWADGVDDGRAVEAVQPQCPGPPPPVECASMPGHKFCKKINQAGSVACSANHCRIF
jgi:hypothetical protein